MNLFVHLNIAAFPMIILTVIYVSLRRNAIQTMENHLFRNLVLFTIFMQLSELFSWATNGWRFPMARPINMAANMMYFMLIPCVAVLWLSYVYYYIDRKYLFARRSKFAPFVMIPWAIYTLLLLSSPWTGLIFSLDADNLYTRGPLLGLSNALCIYYMFMAFVITLAGAATGIRKYRTERILVNAAFTALPICASIVQALVENLWVVLPSTAISEMMLYIHLQRSLIKKDALTGINNRGCLDDYLRQALGQIGKRRSLCLYMIDLDHFKRINDTYGHQAGDAALIRASSVLKAFLHGTDGFLARYGGDEFCIVAYCKAPEDAEKTARRLEEAFSELGVSHEPYSLTCTVGYCYLDENQSITPARAVEIADKMLYRCKNGRNAE